MEHRGEAADGCSGFARGGAVQRWCRRHGIPRQAAFYFGKYGRDAACELAREFCRRGEYFYQLDLEAEDDNFEYTDSHVSAYLEGDCLLWRQFMAAQDAEVFLANAKDLGVAQNVGIGLDHQSQHRLLDLAQAFTTR